MTGLMRPSLCSAERLRRPIVRPNYFVIKLFVLASSMYPVLVFPVLRSSGYDTH
jgi:hypothetical protein